MDYSLADALAEEEAYQMEVLILADEMVAEKRNSLNSRVIKPIPNTSGGLPTCSSSSSS